MLFFTFLLIGEQISASIFGGFRKKSYLCTAIRKKWRFRLGVRTHASHAWNTGSIPVVATKEREKQHRFSLFFCLDLEGVQSSDDRVPLVAHPLTAQITRDMPTWHVPCDLCVHGKRGSNSRHLVLETSALPTELFPCVFRVQRYDFFLNIPNIAQESFSAVPCF